MKLVIASNNAHKITEIKEILKGKFDEMYSLAEMGIDCDPVEDGDTFLANALIKVNEIAKHTNYAVLGDDTGLCVDALDGAPGVMSARYAGDHDSAKNRQKLLCALQNETNRSAHFETVVALRYPDGKIVTAFGRVDGEILTEERGNGGFGYDCLFYSNELNKTFGESSNEEKHFVSHRGRALRNLLEKL